MASRWKTAAVLVLIMAVGFVLRTATLSQQSIWFDEGAWVAKMLKVPSLAAWLQQPDGSLKDMVPLFFVLQYYWYHYLFPSIIGLRWMCVLLSMAVIPLIYVFGRDLRGPSVGLLAALCFALSPLHIYYAQELKPYALMTLLGLVSVYAFYKALHRSGGKWWAVNIVVNSMLMWTHLFGLWLIVTEGFVLLFFHFRPFRRVLAWSAVNAALMVPVGLLVLTWEHPEQYPMGSTWFEILASWVYVDSFYLTFMIYCRSVSLPRELFSGIQMIPQYVYPIGTALFSLCLLGGALVWPATMKHRGDRRLLLAWYVLPSFWLLLFSLAVVPSFQLRYAIYSSPALYLMAAAGIMSVRKAPIRYGLVGLLLITMGCAGVLETVLPVRADEKSAARYVQTHIGPDEKVFWQPDFTRVSFELNIDPNAPPITVTGCTRVHEQLMAIDATLQKDPGVWVLHAHWNPICAVARADALERFLALRKIAFSKRVFPGRWDVLVYHCTPSSEYEVPWNPGAIQHMQDGITSEPRDIPARWRLREMLEAGGRFQEAIESYRQELDAIPSEPKALARLDENLAYVEWDDWASESYVDSYVADLVSALNRVLAAAGEKESHREMDVWCKRFPENRKVQDICARQ